jgi:zinc protease
MNKEFILPDIGEGIVECEVIEWKVKEGDRIEEDQIVVDVSTDKAIVEFVKEISGYVEHGITAEEIAFMRKAINQKDALKYETPRAKLGFLAQILEYNLTPSFVQKQAEIVDNITAAEMNALAKKHLQLDDMLMVVVGDAKTLTPQLKALGYDVVDYKI